VRGYVCRVVKKASEPMACRLATVALFSDTATTNVLYTLQ